MKRWAFFLIPILLLAACGQASSSGNVTGCGEDLQAMSALKSGLRLPEGFQTENPVKTGREFDVMKYFTVLDHLSMEPGYSLDYVYHYDGMGGYPILYAYPTEQSPFATEADFEAAEWSSDYLEHVMVEDTPEGYFQLAQLATTGNQFYLDWHANYNDDWIICDKAGVRSMMENLSKSTMAAPIPFLTRIRATFLSDVEPVVILDGNTAIVKVVTFTKWGGFYLRTFTISRSMPHTILDVGENNILPYDCGVMF
jgi:hypothetical protein